METSVLILLRARQRLNRIESGGQLGPIGEPVRILKTFDQLGDVPSKLRGEPTWAPLPDRIDHFRRPAAEINGLVGADKAGGTLAHNRIFGPDMPFLFMPGNADEGS